MNTLETDIKQINSQFPVVGIGTAASEIDNLIKILTSLSPDSGMTYLIFEDLSLPQHDNLTTLLVDATKIPVQEIVSTVELHPNNIYVIPSNNFLVYENGLLHLKTNTRSSRTTNCMDLFFDALAQKYESYTVGLLLYWSTVDGTAGLKKIKECGGATVSAITKTGFSLNKGNHEFIDYFITPDHTSSTLLEIRHSYQVNQAYHENEISAEEEDIFKSIINVIVINKGTNFHHYKHQTLRRRIAKRMVVTKQESAERYLNLLKNNPAEQELLFNDILIPVTYFFRDASFFESLSSIVFPSLIKTLRGDELRIWSAGCATGEEVYSLAICLDEYLQKTGNSHITVKIFASDLSVKCIEKARAGIYALQDLKNIDEKRIKKYFIKRESGYHVSKTIRDNCVFTVHDLTQDFPFSKIDFISCRNVLIYFNAELQSKVLASFHYALRDNGFLFLGKSESVYTAQNLFDPVEKKEKIYLRKTADNRFGQPTLRTDENHIKNKIKRENTDVSQKDFLKITSDILLDQYSPAAVLIREDFEIVHFHGDTSPFLQPPTGKPSFNITNMVHQELRFSLRNAILKTRNEKKNFKVENIAVRHQSFKTSFETVCLPSHTELLLVIFCRHALSVEKSSDTKDLNKDFLLLQSDFKQLSEEQQIYFEELQTTNEELVRRTEELQFLNEQLEISAEELRSNNEELSCTNDELRDRRNELWAMRDFYESIVKTIKEPLLIIDKNFMVHSANPAFYSYFRMKEELTEGFSLFDLGNSQWNTTEFKENVLKKISRNEAVDNIKIQFDANSNRKKTVLVTAANITDSLPKGLILIAFEDITELEQGNQSLLAKNEELHKHSSELKAFTTAASHNLLDPVRKIYMFGKKIMDNEAALSETSKHYVNRLLSAAANLSQLMEDLIRYSKINFEEKKFKKTDLNNVLKKAIVDLKPIINERNAIIETESLPPLRIIPYQVYVLFTNLISNAVKYSKPDTRPEIKVSTSMPEQDEYIKLGADPLADYIRLSVSDNGIGFNKEFETLVFDPFYKLQSDDQQYGTGLGLTLARQIVSNHKGFIRAVSKPGEGTAIHIYLPLEVSFADTYSEN
jgi:two-component system CheB/CheR fusion protein